MTSYKHFETERLIIRPTDLSDVEFLYRLMNTPKWLHFIGDRNVHSPEDAAEYIKSRTLAQLERLGYGNFTVIRKTDNERIGTCGLYDRPGMEGIDLGFAFLPEYEKQGYAFETASCIRDAAFREFNINGLKAITLPENVSSQRLLEKLGFTLTDNTFVIEDEELLLYVLDSL